MRRWLLALPLLGLLACGRGPAYVLRPASEGPLCFSTQEVLLKLPGGSTERLLTSVENDGRRLTLVASSPLGQTLFILRAEDGRVDLDARVPLPRNLDPRLLATLVQLSDWPLEAARKGLLPGAELREEGSVRTLLQNGQVLLTLDRDGPAPPYKVIRLRLPAQGLEATITTLED